jgi:hypothetical protein
LDAFTRAIPLRGAVFRPAFFLATVFFLAAFGAADDCPAFFRNSAQRFLAASAIRLRPAALILRFGAGAALAVVAGAVSEAFLTACQRRRCASAMRFRAAALILRAGFRVDVSDAGDAGAGAPPSIRLTSAIWDAIRSLCA